jgi:hypothetical protein
MKGGCKMELKDEYKPDELPRYCLTSADFEGILEDDSDKVLYYFGQIAGISNGTIYTQVDSENSNEVIYLTGKHFVNRTGVYAIVWGG